MVLFEVIHDQRDSRDENFEFEEMACYFMQHATRGIEAGHDEEAAEAQLAQEAAESEGSTALDVSVVFVRAANRVEPKAPLHRQRLIEPIV